MNHAELLRDAQIAGELVRAAALISRPNTARSQEATWREGSENSSKIVPFYLTENCLRHVLQRHSARVVTCPTLSH